MPSDPGLTLFHIHAPPLLFELIPLYSMCRLPSSLVRRVSSLPTLRDHVIQPEQYGADSCSRCASIILLCPMPTPLPCCVCQKHNVSAPRDTGGVEGGDTAGRLNEVWQGQSWGIWFAPSSRLLLLHPHPPFHFASTSHTPAPALYVYFLPSSRSLSV